MALKPLSAMDLTSAATEELSLQEPSALYGEYVMLHLDPLARTGDLDAWVEGAEDELEAGFPALVEEGPSVDFDVGLAVFELSTTIGVDDGATYIRVEDGAVDVESG